MGTRLRVAVNEPSSCQRMTKSIEGTVIEAEHPALHCIQQRHKDRHGQRDVSLLKGCAGGADLSHQKVFGEAEGSTLYVATLRRD